MSQVQDLESHIRADEIEKVKKVIAQYCYYLDNRDFDKLKTLFHPDASADYRQIAAAGEEVLESSDDVIEFLRSRVFGKRTHHAISTQWFEWETFDQVAAYTHFTANTITFKPDSTILEVADHVTVFGIYQDILVKKDGVWAIDTRTVIAIVSPLLNPHLVIRIC
jgi:hypothetical protein